MINKYAQRPVLNQVKDYSTEPGYIVHQPYEDQLALLVCQIKIWRPQGHDWFNIPSAENCLTIRECHSIEITDTTKEVINKAVVKFSRGTVIAESNKLNVLVQTGNTENNTATTTTVAEATNNGDVVTSTNTVSIDEGGEVTPLEADAILSGLVGVNENKNDPTKMVLLSPKSVRTGNRIQIRLGYAYSEAEFEEMNSADSHENMPIAFTGFITGISSGTPLELQCTNMAYVLSCVSTPKIILKETTSVRKFFTEEGDIQLLKNTGIKLSDSSKDCEVFVNGDTITHNLTITDVLKSWNENAGVISMMEIMDDGSTELRIGLGYYIGARGNDLPNNDPNYITYKPKDDRNLTTFVQFDWDVAEDKLSVNTVDKKYLAVKATGRSSIGKLISVTIRKNPNTEDDSWEVGEGDDNFKEEKIDIDSRTPKTNSTTSSIQKTEESNFNADGTAKTPKDEDDGFQEVNRNEVHKKAAKRRSRKKKRKTRGVMAKETVVKTVVTGKLDKAKLREYTVVPYISASKEVTPEQLAKEAKEYWKRYNPSGISGSITVFGDIPVRPSQIIGLIDPRNPGRDGFYYVEAVNTSFGVNGYRRELTIPHRIAKFTKPVQIIR